MNNANRCHFTLISLEGVDVIPQKTSAVSQVSVPKQSSNFGDFYEWKTTITGLSKGRQYHDQKKKDKKDRQWSAKHYTDN